MIDPGKVQGHKLIDLFGELVEKKIILSMHVVGTGFERLTWVIGIREEQKTDYLLIDLPDGFGVEAAKFETLNLRFNFNGPDHLEYLFSTTGGEYERGLLKVPFPEFVERLQRRRNFRVPATPGARVTFKVKKIQGLIGMINISLGGVYGALLKHNAEETKGSILKLGQRVLKLSLFLPADETLPEQVITIRRSEVRRVEHDKHHGIYKYAFEFLDIDKDEHQKLTQAIYHMQRIQLQRR
jgi:hypothetical protein